jgi:hypothetical protein
MVLAALYRVLVVGSVVDEEVDCLLTLKIDDAQVIALGELAAEGAGLDDAIGKGRARVGFLRRRHRSLDNVSGGVGAHCAS